MEFSLTPELMLLLLATGMLAGFVDAIAGGGGLIALPVLLFSGLSPAQALATNKLQSSFGTLSATLYFIRQGLVDPRRIGPMVLCTFVGASLGAQLVQRIDPGFLTAIIPLLLILIALYFWLSPQVGEEDVQQRLGPLAFALTIGTGVGFYDGFFGPGTGSFFAIAFVTLMGFGLSKATAHTKVLNLTSNVAALLAFIAGGQVVWTLGLLMAAGQLVGARLGARLVVLKGSKLIRPLVVGVCIVMSLKLLLG
jgi:hypothetical protein